MLKSLARGADDRFGLVSEVGSELAMRSHDFARRMDFFAVARGVRGDLGGLLPGAACALKILTNLLAARAGCVKVLLRVALDFRRAAAANGDLVTKLAKPVGQLRLINGGGELLRGEETLRLDGSRLAILPLGHVEDDCMGMKLRRNVTIDRAGGVVFKLRGDEFGRRLGRMISADASLRVHFELLQARHGRSRDGLYATLSSPPTSAVSEMDLGAENVASQPARCSIVLTVLPSASWYS